MKTAFQNAAWLVLALGAVALAGEQYITQEATGEAAIVNGDTASAAALAKESAIRDAVQQAAGVILEADSQTVNSQLVRDQITTHSQGYVHSSKELSRKVEGNVVKVTMSVEVGRTALDKDLQAVRALVKRLQGSKLVILLNEQSMAANGSTVSSGVTSTVLTDAFKKDGWTIIDPSFLAGKVRVASGVSLGQAEAKEIGNLAKADYIVYGTVNFHNQPPDAQWDVDAQGKQQRFLVTGNYEFSVFATDSGTQIAKIADKFDSGAVGDKKPALLTSYERTAFDIIQLHQDEILNKTRGAVVDYLRAAELDGRRLVMTVNGLPNYSAAKDFIENLKGWTNAVKGTSNVTFGSGKAQLDVQFVGTTDELADQLGGKKFHGRQVSVTGVSGNAVEVSLTR
jgi:hypothetical protein